MSGNYVPLQRWEGSAISIRDKNTPFGWPRSNTGLEQLLRDIFKPSFPEICPFGSCISELLNVQYKKAFQ